MGCCGLGRRFRWVIKGWRKGSQLEVVKLLSDTERKKDAARRDRNYSRQECSYEVVTKI